MPVLITFVNCHWRCSKTIVKGEIIVYTKPSNDRIGEKKIRRSENKKGGAIS